MRPDVLVLGTGRSGTSFVGEVLHNHFGVCMGHADHQVNRLPFNKYYECKLMFDATLNLCGRFGVTGSKPGFFVDDWFDVFYSAHKDCNKHFYGVKNKHLCWLTCKQLIDIAPKLIICTHRNLIDTAKSFSNFGRKGRILSEKQWLDVVKTGEESLSRLEAAAEEIIPWVNIQIPGKNEPRMSRDELIAKIDPYIEEFLKCNLPPINQIA